MALGLLALAAGLVFAAGGGTPQASITLQNSDAKYCYTHDNTWMLTKEVTGNTVENGVGTVTWTVTATKDSSGAPTFTVHGGLTVYNSGTAPATIGNIVVNLQKPNSPKKQSNAPYVSIAADVADATTVMPPQRLKSSRRGRRRIRRPMGHWDGEPTTITLLVRKAHSSKPLGPARWSSQTLPTTQCSHSFRSLAFSLALPSHCSMTPPSALRCCHQLARDARGDAGYIRQCRWSWGRRFRWKQY